MFAHPLPSILTHFQPIMIENLSNPIRIKSKSIYFPCLGSLAGVIISGSGSRLSGTLLGGRGMAAHGIQVLVGMDLLGPTLPMHQRAANGSLLLSCSLVG